VAAQFQLDLKPLQRQCWLALNLYTDLADACCAVLINAEAGPLSASEYARFIELRREESKALAEYLQARIRLMALLSVAADPSDRRVWLALNVQS
jgi:hypothetical protein